MVSKILSSFAYLMIFNVYAATPKITSILPATLSCGVDNCLNKTITITGSGFNNDANVPALKDLAGCSVVSSKKITCTLLSQPSAGSFTLNVKNEQEGSASTVSNSNFKINFAAPKVSSVSPSTLTCGSNDCLNQVILIKGSNFRSGATVPALADLATCGAPSAAGTQISCTLNAQTKSARYTLAVRNVNPDQTASVSSSNFSIFLTPFTVTSISPTSLTCGTEDCVGKTIIIKGTGFKSDATVPALSSDGVDLATCAAPNDTGTQITCTLKAQSASGSYKLAVKTANKTSLNAPVLTIKTTALSVASVSPSSVDCGAEACLDKTITIKGTGFKSDVKLIGLEDLALCTAPNAAGTEFSCKLKVQSLAKTYNLSVKNESANTTSLNSVKLIIGFSVPKVTSVEPSTLNCGIDDCVDQKITINGTGFLSDATVPALTGLATCTAPYETGSKIDCTLKAQSVSASYKLAVKNNSLNQIASVSTNNFTVNLTPLSITTVSPSNISCGWNQCEDEKITITGTGFRSDAKVSALTGLATCEAPKDGGTKIDCTLKKHSSRTSYKLNVLNVAKNKSTNVASTNLQVNLKALPSISSIGSDTQPNCSGYKVTIIGTNFSPNANLVDFPGYCEAPTDNGTKILCVTSKQTNLAQAYNLRISNPNIADSTKNFISTSFKRLTLASNAACPSLTYATPNAEYPVYEEIIENTPVITGFTPTSYSISPELPDGLEFDSTTGVISGTPTTVFEGSTFNITASNSELSLTNTINLSSKVFEMVIGGDDLIAHLKEDGSVNTWGASFSRNGYIKLNTPLTNVKKILGGPSFAALKYDDTIVTWGNPTYGGDSSSVQAQLTDITNIFFSGGAFAAIKKSGSVVTWGSPSNGGDSSAVQAQLTNVKTIYSSGSGAFAALTKEGKVVTWGDPGFGGDSSAVQAQLTNVKSIYSDNFGSFVALKNDGTVVTWGSFMYGDGSAVVNQLTNVKTIYTKFGSVTFVALKNDGTVVTWPVIEESTIGIPETITNVKHIYPNSSAFAALKNDGTVVTWGRPKDGGDSSAVKDKLTNVKSISAIDGIFAALKTDGSVVMWGNTTDSFYSGFGYGNLLSSADLTNVKSIVSNGAALAFIKNDGKVILYGDTLWGANPEYYGHSSLILSNIKNIIPGYLGFYALKNDGRVLSWGLGQETSQYPINTYNKIISNGNAFVLQKFNGLEHFSLSSWGDTTRGGDSSNLIGKTFEFFPQIFSNNSSFVSFFINPSNGFLNINAWGDTLYGGSIPSSISSKNYGYSYVEANAGAYALTYYDGIWNVATWGDTSYGGDNSAVQVDLKKIPNVPVIYSTSSAFAAISNSSIGPVVTWGDPTAGGDSSAVQSQLTNVSKIFSTSYAFAALKSDGTVVTWGDADYGGDSSEVQSQLTDVKTIYSNATSFAALKNDGTVVTWGLWWTGGDSSDVKDELTNVYKVYSNSFCHAALKKDGTVVTWGNLDLDGNYQCDASSVTLAELTNVEDIVASEGAFAALKNDGTVVTWGSQYGGDSSAVQDKLNQVIKIVSYTPKPNIGYMGQNAFAALKQDGTVVTWGLNISGGDSSSVQNQLTDVIDISSSFFAFAALKKDETVVTWGVSSTGGDYPNSYVPEELGEEYPDDF